MMQVELPLPVDISTMIVEVERELAARRKLYPNRLLTKRLSQSRASQRMATLEAIARLLHAIQERGELPPDIFKQPR